MIGFASAPAPFRGLGLGLFLALTGSGLFALPPLHAGLWISGEVPLLAIFLGCSFACLWLWIGILKGWLAVEKPLPPLILLWMAWVAWQCIVTLFVAELPWRSWFGNPAHGEGAAWYCAMLIAIFLACPLWRHAPYRRVLLVWGAAVIAILAALHATTRPFGQWSPNPWGDYLAFMAGWLWIAAALATPMKFKHFLMAGAALLLALVAAGSKSALILFPPAMIAMALLRHRHPHPAWRKLAIAGLFVPALWIVFSLMKTDLPQRNSFVERMRYNQVAVETITQEPTRLLAGAGWMHFVDDLMKYAMVDGVHRFKDGKSDINVNFISGGEFHTHSQPLEALLALGIPGFVLWFAIPICIIRRIPDERFWDTIPVLVAVYAFSYFWFPVAQILAFQALGTAALVAGGKAEKTYSAEWGFAFVPIAFLLLWSGGEQAQAIGYGEMLRSIPAARYETVTEELLNDDLRRGGDRLRIFTNQFIEDVYLENIAIDENVAGWFGKLMESAHEMARTPRIGAYSGSLELAMQTLALANINDPYFTRLKQLSARFIGDSVLRVTEIAPEREDLTAIYLYLLKTDGDDATLLPLLGKILAIAPDHRSALWLKGRELMKNPATRAEGKAMAARAAALGVERVYPVSEAEIKTISTPE